MAIRAMPPPFIYDLGVSGVKRFIEIKRHLKPPDTFSGL